MLLAPYYIWSIDSDSEFERGYLNFKMMPVKENIDVSIKMKSLL